MYDPYPNQIRPRHVYYEIQVLSFMAERDLGKPITMTGRIVKSGPRYSITIPPEYIREKLLGIDTFYEITLRPVKKMEQTQD